MSIKKTINVFADEHAYLKLCNNRLLCELNEISHEELMCNPYTDKKVEKEQYDKWMNDMNLRKNVLIDEWRSALQ